MAIRMLKSAPRLLPQLRCVSSLPPLPVRRFPASSASLSRRYSSSSSSKRNGSAVPAPASSSSTSSSSTSSSPSTGVGAKRIRAIRAEGAERVVTATPVASGQADVTASPSMITSIGNSAASSVVAVEAEELPSVPSTDHLHISDVAVSSFFALHRPVSITDSVPSISSSENFSQLFQSAEAKSAFSFQYPPEHSLDASFQSLQEAVASMSSSSAAASPADGGLAPADSLSALFRPFQPPPSPEPINFDKQMSSQEQSRRQSSRELQFPNVPGMHAGRRVITIVTTPTADGGLTFRASASLPSDAPLTSRLLSRRRELEMFRRAVKEPEAHGEAVLIGEIDNNGQMQAISVLRQRKLKMKKHKLKKLRKRTRHLRRKLESQ